MTGPILVALLLSTAPSAETRPQGTTAQICHTEVDGSTHPEALPSFVPWEAVFLEASDASTTLFLNTDLTPDDVLSVRTQARHAVGNARNIRSSALPQREHRAADEILQARDRLLRTLSIRAVRSLEALARGRSQGLRFVVPIPGRARVINSGFVCSTSVAGEEHPHLLPDWVAWRAFFHAYSQAAEPHYTPGAGFNQDFVKGMTTGSLKISPPHMTQFLEIARKALRASQAAELEARSQEEVAVPFIEARQLLLRTMPPATWATISAEAFRLRLGVTYFYPTTPLRSGR